MGENAAKTWFIMLTKNAALGQRGIFVNKLAQMVRFAPLADAHGKQRVSAVLSSVETSDLRNLLDCLPPLKSYII